MSLFFILHGWVLSGQTVFCHRSSLKKVPAISSDKPQEELWVQKSNNVESAWLTGGCSGQVLPCQVYGTYIHLIAQRPPGKAWWRVVTEAPAPKPLVGEFTGGSPCRKYLWPVKSRSAPGLSRTSVCSECLHGYLIGHRKHIRDPGEISSVPGLQEHHYAYIEMG